MADAVGGEAVAHFIDGSWPMLAAWLCFFLTSVSTASNGLRHLVCYSRPDLQPHVLRIIVVGPIYALGAALCLSMTERTCFFVRSVRDIWEAVVIYSFLTLIVEYMGGEHLCLHNMSQRDEAVPHLFPMNLCLPPIPMASMIRIPKMGALQFVVVKPVVALVSIVAYAAGDFETPYYQWAIFIVYNISYSVALYALYLVYWASHEHQALQAKRPLLKFVSVKMIVFLTFWQAFLLPHMPLPGSPARWEDVILAVEMVIFSLLLNTAFSWREFHSGLKGTAAIPKGLCLEGGDLIDLSDDTCVTTATTGSTVVHGQPVGAGDAAAAQKSSSVAFSNRQVLVNNAKAAFCPKDVLDDASHNFSRRYAKHVLIESAQEYELHNSSVDLLGDLSEAQGGAACNAGRNGFTQKASGSPPPGGVGRTFRARTYLIGHSMGAWRRGGKGDKPSVQATNIGAAGASLADEAACSQNTGVANADSPGVSGPMSGDCTTAVVDNMAEATASPALAASTVGCSEAAKDIAP